MIEDTLNNWFTNTWHNIWYYVSGAFVDPYWYWLFVVVVLIIVITAAEVLIRFYFADIPWLRKTGGLVIIGLIVAILAYARGEKDARAHDKDAKPTPKPKPKPPTNTPPWWF